MDGRYLLEKMDQIDPKYIEEAENAGKRRPALTVRILKSALAACILLTMISGVIMFRAGAETALPEAVSSETASVFGSGNIGTVMCACSLVASVAIGAVIAEKKKNTK